jgi:LysR family transcriptional activator of glutamate synthase operon
MDLRQLRSPITVAEERQFTRAAERLGIAQSSLSAQIRLLEQEIGLPLFDRTTRRVTVTSAGEALIATARSVLAEIDDTKAELQRHQALLSGHVTIGITQTPGSIDVVALLADFHRQHPAIELSVREELSVNLASELRNDLVDIAILTVVEPSDCQGLQIQPLCVERLVAVLPTGHRLASEERVDIDQLRERISLSHPRCDHQDRCPSCGAGGELRAADCFRVTGSHAYSGVCCRRTRNRVPASTSPGPGVASVELDGEQFNHTLSLCWRDRRRHSPAARALLEHARAMLAPATP